MTAYAAICDEGNLHKIAYRLFGGAIMVDNMFHCYQIKILLLAKVLSLLHLDLLLQVQQVVVPMYTK